MTEIDRLRSAWDRAVSNPTRPFDPISRLDESEIFEALSALEDDLLPCRMHCVVRSALEELLREDTG